MTTTYTNMHLNMYSGRKKKDSMTIYRWTFVNANVYAVCTLQDKRVNLAFWLWQYPFIGKPKDTYRSYSEDLVAFFPHDII